MIQRVGYCAFPLVLALGTGVGTPSWPSVSPSTAAALIVLGTGTGTPNADSDRSGPAVAVVVNDFAYLVDAGPGVARRAPSGRTRNRPLHVEGPLYGKIGIPRLHSE